MSEERDAFEPVPAPAHEEIAPVPFEMELPVSDEAGLPDETDFEFELAASAEEPFEEPAELSDDDADDESLDYDYEDDEDDEDDEEEDDSSDRAYMQNRELSWLTFNERVLDQGADESVPLLERLNFISIFWSNLQEFFMVRVGSLTDLSFIDPPVIDSKTGMTPKDQIRAIHERCKELYPIQESTYEHVRGQLAKEGVRHLRPDDLSDEQRNYLFGLVKHNIEPFLSPQIINARHPFPHLENGKLYILVRLDDEADDAERKKKKKKKGEKAKKEKGGAEGVVLGLIPLPHQCERVIKLPGRGFQFILLEHAIELFVPEIFSMYKIKHTNVICVTRNADIDANQGFDEQDEDYREHMKRLLKQRARLAPVRLECERPLSPVMEKLLLKKLDLKRYQMYDTIVPLDLSFTWGLGSRLSEKKCARLSNPPFTPAWPTCFDRNRRIIDQVAERDVLISYPYESIDSFVQLLREAANDPDVISIKITLYRLASQSHIAEALIAAADAGKEVTALFELRARFDENNNIEWSQRFEQAGCNVLYGFRDYKVHSKICCITRRTANGAIQHITQLGTGNYNEKTARLYTDFAFITADETFGRDAVEFFRNMQLENVSDSYEKLCVAPLQIKKTLIENLDKQIERAQQGLPASAFMKANSVTDKDILEKISEASNAGVRITLFIRGICCLIPHVKGATENVRVVSIVGRLLEHSRIYCFGPADDCTVYLSSADLMTRNLNKRVEIAWPLPQGEIMNKVLSYIDVCMHDTAKLRELRPNATYTPLGAFCELDEDGNPEPPFDAQNALIERAADAAAEAEKEAEREAAVISASVTQRIPVIVVDEAPAETAVEADEGVDQYSAEVLEDEPSEVSEGEDSEEQVDAASEAPTGEHLTDLTIEELLAAAPAVAEVPLAAEAEPEPRTSIDIGALADAVPVPVEGIASPLEAAQDSVTEPVEGTDLVAETAETAEAVEAASEQTESAEPEPEVVEEPAASAVDAGATENLEAALFAAESSAAPELVLPEIELPATAAEEPAATDDGAAPEAPVVSEDAAPVDEAPVYDEPSSVVPAETEAEVEEAPVPDTAQFEAPAEPAPSVEQVAEPVGATIDFDLGSVLAATPETESAVAPEAADAVADEHEIAPAVVPESVIEPIPIERIDLSNLPQPTVGVSEVAPVEVAPTVETAPEVAPSFDAAPAGSVQAPEPQETASSDRVSELIAQLSASPGQDVPLSEETAVIEEAPAKAEQLTEMTLDDILSQPEGTSETAPAPAVAEAPFTPAVVDGQAPAESAPEPAPAATPEPQAEAAQKAEPAAEDKPAGEEAPGFFDGASREIEMPPDSRQGFFSRFRK